MKKVFSCAALVVLIFAASAEARPPCDWLRTVKILKSWIAKTLGDGLSDPKP